jgi:two-component system chemotaxis sensor kinase CheA
MPRLSGIELTRRVRANKNLRDLPVILVSSMNKPEDLAAGVNAGADEYIVKGTFDQTTLLEVVSKYL